MKSRSRIVLHLFAVVVVAGCASTKVSDADEGTPVTESYKVPFKFTAKIDQVTIDLKEIKKADIDDVDHARMAAALKKGLSD
jgi:outer membrane murein-binding lipoprotein Lpp